MFISWPITTVVLARTRVRVWWAAVAATAAAGLVLWVQGVQEAFQAHLWLVEHLLLAAGRGDPVWPLIGAGVVRMLPLGLPAGVLIGCATANPTSLAGPAGADTAATWGAGQAPGPQRTEPKQLPPRKVERLVARAGADPRHLALGVDLGGDLDGWRRRRYVIPPAGHLGLATLLIGAPGAGKSVAIHRLAYLAGLERRHLVVLDAKGGHDGLAGDVVAAYLTARPDAHVRLFPQEPIDLWRGTPGQIVNRLVEVWDFSPEAAFYREVAVLALRLALGAPGEQCTSTAELVRRLAPGVLADLWRQHPVNRALVADLKPRLPDVQLRVSNLVASLSGSFDGAWSFEDVDLAVITVPSLAAPTDADAALRVLLADYGHYVMTRKPPGLPSLAIFDEFSALAGGRRLAINLLERARGAGAGVILAGQSVEALGDDEERARLLGAAAAVIGFRQPQPAVVSSLAGTISDLDAAVRIAGGEFSTTYTQRQRARVDHDLFRSAPTGVATVIAAGRAQRLRIIRTQVAAEVTRTSQELVAPTTMAEVERTIQGELP
jgi:hypothetical protein